MNIVVLDYSCSQVFIYQNVSIPEPKENEDFDDKVQEFLDEKGFHLSNCEWMSSEEEIKINR